MSLGFLPGGLTGCTPAEQASGLQVKGYFSLVKNWKFCVQLLGASSQPAAKSRVSAGAAIMGSLRPEGMKHSQICFSD